MNEPETKETRAAGFKTAMSLYNTGNYAQAADLLEPLIGDASLQGHLSRFYHTQACRLEAERLINSGSIDPAVSLLQRGTAHNPQSTHLINFLAQCYLHQGRYEQAGRELTRLSDLNTTTPVLRLKEGLSYFLAGNTGKAIAVLEPLVKEFPSNFDINFNLGLILAQDDQLDRASLFLTQACRLRPENVDVRWKLALVHGLRGHLMESIRHLQQAHRIEPQNNWLLCHLTLAVKQARYQGIEVKLDLVNNDAVSEAAGDESLEKLAEMIAREPEFITAFFDLPETDIDNQIFSSLLKIIMRALEHHPEYADLHYHCSCVLRRLGRADEAIRESEQAVGINPRYVSALVQLGALYAQADRDQEAIDRLKSAVVHGANYADVHYLLGKLYHKKGSIDHARRHYQRALQINHGYQAAQDALASLAA